MKEFERNNSNLSEENKNLKEKLEAKREEKSLIDSFVRFFPFFHKNHSFLFKDEGFQAFFHAS